MTISLRGSATGLAAGTTTALAFTLPTGVTTNDLMLALVGTKPFGNSVASGTLTTDGWSAQSAGSNGSTANGIDTGSVWAIIYSKVHDGSEVAPTGTLGTTPSPRMSGMLALQSTRTGSGWSVSSTNASDATATGTSVSLTGAANLAVDSGDVLVVLVVHKTDSATHTSPSLTLSGATISGLTQQFATTTTTSGNDGAMYVYTANVSGTATAAPVFTVTTVSGSSDAQAVFLRIREPQNASDTAAGTITSTGTVVGREGHRGLVAATITSTGTAVGQEHHFGAVTASTTSTGTAAGREGHKGIVSATITSTGTVVRSEQHTGTVTGTITSTGTVVGIQADRGTVSATITASATVVGAKYSADAVSATITSTGVVVASEHHFGQVDGSITSSATVTGYKPTDDRFGSAYGTIISTGTIGPVPPAPPAPEPSGGGYLVEFARPRREPRRPRPVERKSGRVTALCVSTGRVTGRRASTAAASAATTLRCAIASSKQARALVLSDMTDHETRVTGAAGVRDSEYLALYAELRRTRDDHDLLMLL